MSGNVNLTLRVQRALAEASGHRLQAHRLAIAADATSREFNKRAADMVARGVISREKIRDAGHAYYWYSLNAAQLAKAKLLMALADVDQTAGAALVVEEVDLPGRLSFLRMLRDQTVFGNHVALSAIIGDYERTARLRRAAGS
ncbi:hypothetical protein NHH73_25020 [Oxalobacteraceae bacterium OTU3CINTB1]|nr:hypothetical protein NHH73_25020 [Oxalobacteraceae bacterium OTU3CINTB1]